MNLPRITVVIVTYNAARTLKTAIDSVLKQTYKNVECLIIDGNSNDNTLEIIKSYGDKIKYISEKDQGIYDAMNKGWKRAKGEWILYLGADDMLYEEGLKKLIDASEDGDVIYGAANLIFPTGKTKIRVSLSPENLRYRMCCCHQALMLRKKCLQEVGGFSLSYPVLGDFDLTQRVYFASYKFIQLDEVIALFSVGGVSSDNLRMEVERYKILKANQAVKFPIFYCGKLALRKLLIIIKHKLEYLFLKI